MENIKAQTSKIKLVQIGVGVIIKNERNEVLLGYRLSKHGEGTWGFPGGKLELGETPIECAIRETQEEIGQELFDALPATFTNDDYFSESDQHFITLYILGTITGQPQVMEPTKCQRWEWFSWDSLPKPLFLPIHNLKKQGFSIS